MKNMTIYRAYSTAHYLQESLLLAYAEHDQFIVKYRMEDAEEKLRELAEGMGFDLTRRGEDDDGHRQAPRLNALGKAGA